MVPLPPGVQIVHRDGGNIVAVWENLVLAVWRESPTVSSMQAIHDSHLKILEHRASVAHLVLVDGTPKMPTPEARDRAARYSSQSRMNAIAIVLDGQGFWMSAARAFLTTILFVTRNDAPTKLFADIDDAVAWQAQVLGEAEGFAYRARAAITGLRAFSGIPLPAPSRG